MKLDRPLALALLALSLPHVWCPEEAPSATSARALQDEAPGYDDTPVLPGSTWRVHDKARPRPRLVEPGEGSRAPSDATVLFDGVDQAAWKGGPWKIVDGALQVAPGSGTLETKEHFGDVQLHLEWRSPAEVVSSSQGRGNSGVFLMGRYEVQILDSFENPSYADGQAAALYGQFPPAVNATRAPGEWQTYDILFRAPRFEEQRLVSPAVVTVLHNGVAVHHAVRMLGATSHRTLPSYAAHAETGPIRLQDHGNPVQFRNVWVRPLTPAE